MPVCEIDLRVGGTYRYVWRKAGAPDMGMGGVYREVVAPERIVASEKFDQAWYPGEAMARSCFSNRPARPPSRRPCSTSRKKRATDPQVRNGTGVAAAYGRLPNCCHEVWKKEQANNERGASNTNIPRSIGAIFRGFRLCIIVTLATDQLLHVTGVFPPWGASMAGYDAALLLATAYRIVYGIAGSYVTARLAPDRPCSTRS